MTYHKKSKIQKEADEDVALIIVIVIAIPLVIIYLGVSGTYYGAKYIAVNGSNAVRNATGSCYDANDVIVTTQTKPVGIVGKKADVTLPVPPQISALQSPPQSYQQISALQSPQQSYQQISALQTPSLPQITNVFEYRCTYSFSAEEMY